MVSEPLLWPFLSSLVFISVTSFSTSLPPSQQPPQPLAVEPSTSSNHRPWDLDLQPPLRSFTFHRPLPFASPLQILLRLRLWRYHWDRLAPIYTLVEASMPSKTTRAPTRRSKVLLHWSCVPRAFHVPLHIWVFSYVLPRATTSGQAPLTRLHALSRASTHLNHSRWRHCWHQPLLRRCWHHLLASTAYVIFWLWGFDSWLFRFNCWLWPSHWLLTFL